MKGRTRDPEELTSNGREHEKHGEYWPTEYKVLWEQEVAEIASRDKQKQCSEHGVSGSSFDG